LEAVFWIVEQMKRRAHFEHPTYRSSPMLLSRDDAELFFRLYRSLMYFVNQRLGVVSDVADPDDFGALPLEARLEVRKAFLDDVDLIETFVHGNPSNLGDDELDIVLSWRHQVPGKFYVFRQLKNYMVFLDSGDPPVAYGVVALTEPFEDLIGPYLPRMTETVLLPFKDRIVYDGLLRGYNIAFGGGIRRMLNNSYRQAKERLGIVTSLPIESIPIAATKSSKLRKPKKSSKKRRSSVAAPPRPRVYQLKITLKGIRPPIWRRIQVHDCALDELHEHIQTAMGWTNSHLHQFEIDGECYGNPELLDDGFMDFECLDSTVTKISDIVSGDGHRLRFLYEYDFGDGWEHDVLFEGFAPAEPNRQYPMCVKGKRACPPEDVGGAWGYAEFLQAMADPGHERHDELLDWSGPFDPDAFDAAEATRAMQEGLPAWR